MRLFTLTVVILCACGIGFAQAPPDLVDDSVLTSAKIKNFRPTPHDLTNGMAHSRFGIFGIDSIPNFNGQFFADGFDSSGNANRHWYVNTVGNPPQMGGTTTIGAPLQAVNVELDDKNGNPRFIGANQLLSLATPFVTPVLNSPVFSNALYTSSNTPTQFTDAVQRAEFFNNPMKPDWHTMLNPRVPAAYTLHLRQAATCPSGPNAAGCNYVFALHPDGTCCQFIFAEANAFSDGLFTAIVTDIAGNVITTKDISSFLFPNTLLYFGDTSQCCVVGFHSYVYDPTTDPEQRWVVNYSSWMTPGLFGPTFSDITALSHEMAETFNDPFVVSDGVHNLTPWWLSPNGNCQNDRETGDVIEGLPNSTYPMLMNGFLYHPQNEALLQWFEFESPSSALGGAYSYPNTALLTSIPAVQKALCQ